MTSFLDVEQSFTDRRWLARLDAGGENIAKAIQQHTGASDIVARVLAGRGVEPESAQLYLNPSLKQDMPDPSDLIDMDVAAHRIADAVVNAERIAIFGDYDVDGACSAALLFRYFRAYGCDGEIYIPDRIIEGYGPNSQAIGELADRGAQLIICVDCGSTSHDAIAHANRLGVDVVVIDHHQVGVDLPSAHALVNPNRQDDVSGHGNLAAVGVTFLTLAAVSRILRQRDNGGTELPLPDLLEDLDLAALGTVCDVVPLTGFNRALVKKGLVALRHGEKPGLRALVEVARLKGPIDTWHLGFLLGPRINAGGRIGDAALGAKLLVTESKTEARAIAETLNRLNDERQSLEHAAVEEAKNEVAARIAGGAAPAAIVIGRDTWHPGIVGLVASRLKDRFHRPAIAIAFSGDMGTASGRSIAGIDLGGAVRGAVEAGIAVKGGGHAMAAGLTLRRDQLSALENHMDRAFAQSVEASLKERSLAIDAALSADGADTELVKSLEEAGPFGAGNPRPVFAFPSHTVTSASVVGHGHVRLRLASGVGGSLKAIAFRAADVPLGQELQASKGRRLHIAGTLSIDSWGGSPQAQLTVVDAART